MNTEDGDWCQASPFILIYLVFVLWHSLSVSGTHWLHMICWPTRLSNLSVFYCAALGRQTCAVGCSEAEYLLCMHEGLGLILSTENNGVLIPTVKSQGFIWVNNCYTQRCSGKGGILVKLGNPWFVPSPPLPLLTYCIPCTHAQYGSLLSPPRLHRLLAIFITMQPISHSLLSQVP